MSVVVLLWFDSVWRLTRRMGGLGLILLGLADNTPFISAPPGSMDVVLILLAAHHRQSWLYYAFMASLGEILGGYVTYRIAEKSGQETLEKKIGKAHAAKVYRQFDKHGFATVFGGAILPPPFPFTSVLMAAGIMQYSRKKFFIALAGGRTSRFVIEAYLGRIYGQQMIAFFSRHYQSAVYALIAIAVIIGVVLVVYFKYYRSREKRVRAGSLPDQPQRKNSPDS